MFECGIQVPHPFLIDAPAVGDKIGSGKSSHDGKDGDQVQVGTCHNTGSCLRS